MLNISSGNTIQTKASLAFGHGDTPTKQSVLYWFLFLFLFKRNGKNLFEYYRLVPELNSIRFGHIMSLPQRKELVFLTLCAFKGGTTTKVLAGSAEVSGGCWSTFTPRDWRPLCLPVVDHKNHSCGSEEMAFCGEQEAEKKSASTIN